MADSATLAPPEQSKQTAPSADDLASQFNAPSYQGSDAGDNKQGLAAVRNKSRLEQTKQEALSDPLNPNTSAIPQASGPRGYVGQGSNTGVDATLARGGGSNSAPQSEASNEQDQQDSRANESKNPLNTTRKNSNEAPKDEKTTLNGDRAESRKEKEAKSKKQKRAEIIKNYPHPISFTTFMILGSLAVVTDVVSLILLITGVGEIASWLLGALFIGMYWVFIYYRSPKDPAFRKAINIRQVINFVVEMIPFLGSLWIGNTLVMIYVYIMITSYEAGRFTPPPGLKATSGANGEKPQR